MTFDSPSAVDAAISAANAAPGLIIKGRTLKVLKALDKDSVRKKELQKLKNEVHDRRNLYLAKVHFSQLFLMCVLPSLGLFSVR